MNKWVLGFIFIFSTQSISDEWIRKPSYRKPKIKNPNAPTKNKRRPAIHSAPFIKIYGQRKIYN